MKFVLNFDFVLSLKFSPQLGIHTYSMKREKKKYYRYYCDCDHNNDECLKFREEAKLSHFKEGF